MRVSESTGIGSVNEVRIVGRLGAQVSTKLLPSGDEITVFSIVLDRPAREVRGSTRIDTIACVTGRPQLAGKLQGWDAGRWIEAEGVLRRRFWRAGGGLGSAMEVDVRRVKAV
ncbi:MAG: single-stranded DNA-binding protein [Candidatus Nanopelagicales bacterium]|jgi:single-strand DNA-binding protein